MIHSRPAAETTKAARRKSGATPGELPQDGIGDLRPATRPAVNSSAAETRECEGCEQFKGIGVHSPVEHLAYEARLRDENERLFRDLADALTELDARDGTHRWDGIVESLETWRRFDEVRRSLTEPREGRP